MTIIAAAIAAALTANAQEVQAPVAAKPAGQKQNQPEDSTIQKVEVRGSADAYDARRDDTASKIVVNHDEIVKYGDTNVLDVLKRVPGVTVSGGAGRGGEIRMRGLGSGYTQILLNGERAPAGFSLDSLSPDAIERIEVLRAASAEYSTQSIAGTINIVLKKAIKTAQRELKVGYGKGKQINSPTANVQLSDRVGKLSYSVSANVFRSKFYEQADNLEQAFDTTGRQTGLRTTPSNSPSSFTGINISPRLNWTLEGGDTLTSQSFVNIFRFGTTARAHTATLLGDLPPYPDKSQNMTNDNQFFRTDLNWVHQLAAGAKLDMKIGATYGKLANTMYRATGGNPAVEELTRQIDSAGRDRGLNSTGKYTNPLWEGHALAIGWDAGYNTRDDERHERDYLHPSTRIPGADEIYTGYVSRLAVYAQDEWNVTPRWSVYLGSRWEGIRIRAEGNSFGTTHSSSSVWSPILQTLYKLPDTKGDQLRLAVTRTYKAPDLQRLLPHRFTSVNNNQVEPDSQGNPNLKPELALGVDAAYEHYWSQGALFSVAASTRRITDYTRNLVVFDGSRWVSLPSNSGRAQTHSLEVEAKFPLKLWFASAPAIDVRANVARNWSRVDSVPGPNNRLDQQTPLSANFGLDYKAGPLTTGGSFTFKNGGEVRVSHNQIAYVNVKRDLDLYALWKFDPKVQLRVATANLLNQDSVGESSYSSDAGVLRSRTTSLRTPSLRATLEMKF
ncbi:TonB-dependent receptor plug domain-containing protein [Massilia horti]|uniref:TonB-dependent receptor plug domain-containing protein n=1 Tax=Massilia horti TaxID=2562153 RepID=UPI001E56FE08|nr:TonB-dependent receptor [Massilia horti]